MKIPFINQQELKISNKLKAMLTNTLQTEQQSNQLNLEEEDDLIFNFRDPDYSSELGGYHPVEVRIIKNNGSWKFDYITDFTFLGSGHCAELTKEIDFDFGNDMGFHLYTGSHSLIELRELYEMWESNFLSYVEMDCFTVSVTCN